MKDASRLTLTLHCAFISYDAGRIVQTGALTHQYNLIGHWLFGDPYKSVVYRLDESEYHLDNKAQNIEQ